VDSPDVINQVDRWFVVFAEADVTDWWRVATRPGFRHVYAFGAECRDRWILVDWASDGMAVVPLTGAEVDRLVLGIHLTGGRILRFDRWPGRRRRTPVVCWCVPFVKHLIGLPGFALTPYQLYREMLHSGASPAFQETPDGRHVLEA
jgi:hypothetical protein